MIKASFALTETGALRNENQDHYLLDPEAGLFAVADGLGGLPNGKQASVSAIEILQKKLEQFPETGLDDLMAEVNRDCRSLGFDLSASGFGTTLTLVRHHPMEGSIELAHVGDSSAYLVSEGRMTLLTEEHTVAARMIATNFEAACEAIPASAHHTLTQCIGQEPYIDPQLAHFPVRPGDRLFLFSDGVTKPLEEATFRECLLLPDPVQRICQALSFRIEIAGSPDNYTLVGVEF